jgi:hypothetical protein
MKILCPICKHETKGDPARFLSCSFAQKDRLLFPHLSNVSEHLFEVWMNLDKNIRYYNLWPTRKTFKIYSSVGIVSFDNPKYINYNGPITKVYGENEDKNKYYMKYEI